ncbi:MAG: hypothetical protein AAGF46_04780, partial [Pseudomonadota bacterium]
EGIAVNYIDANAHLVDFYKRLGYREHLGWIQHKDYGDVYSMVLHLADLQHLRRVRSPLLNALITFNQSLNNIHGAINNEQVA